MLIFSIIVFYFFVRLWLSDTEKTNIVKWENIGGHEFVVLAKFLQFLQSVQKRSWGNAMVWEYSYRQFVYFFYQDFISSYVIFKNKRDIEKRTRGKINSKKSIWDT